MGEMLFEISNTLQTVGIPVTRENVLRMAHRKKMCDPHWSEPVYNTYNKHRQKFSVPPPIPHAYSYLNDNFM